MAIVNGLGLDPEGTLASTFAQTSAASAEGASHISIFSGSNSSPPLGVGDLPNQRELQEGFSALVGARSQYLLSLSGLRHGWISGKGETPSQGAIALSMALLEYIQRVALSRVWPFIPRLVMGPLLSGGISVELHARDDSAIFVNINNNAKVEIEVKYRGYYSTVGINAIAMGSKVLSRYDAIANG